MSGFKKTTVAISQEEYRRLHEAEMKLRLEEKKKVLAESNLTQKAVEVITDCERNLEDRESYFREMISGLNHHIRNYELETSETLVQQHEAWANQMRTEMSSTMGEDLQNLSSRLEGAFQQFEDLEERGTQKLLQLRERLNSLSQRADRKTSLASQWIQSTGVILDFIHQNYHHELTFPGQVNEIEEAYNRAVQSLKEDMPEAAYSIAQESYTRVSTLRKELEKREQEWLLLLDTVRNRFHHLQANLEASRNCTAMDWDGKTINYQVDVNYWTDHKLDKLVEYTHQMTAYLEDPSNLITLEILRQIQNTELPNLEKELDDTVAEARLETLKSQLRINVADIVLQALAGQGFELSENGYHEGDQRASFEARTINLEGSEVAVQVESLNSDPCAYDIDIHSSDHLERYEYELKNRANTILNALRKCGLQVSPIKIISEVDEKSLSRTESTRLLPLAQNS